MKKNALYIIVILIVLINYSCQSTIVEVLLDKKADAFRTETDIEVYKNSNKTIVMIPMIHIGKKEFYNKVKDSVMKYKAIGGIVFYESVTIKDLLPESEIVIIKKKFRKYIGFSFNKSGYIDTINNTLSDGKIKLNPKWGLINQPRYSKLGVDKFDRLVDVPINKLVEKIEGDYGIIELDSCDINTSLDETYNCNSELKIKKKSRDNILLNFRNTHIFNEIKKENNNLIILVYGGKHFVGLKEYMEEDGYKKVKKR